MGMNLVDPPSDPVEYRRWIAARRRRGGYVVLAQIIVTGVLLAASYVISKNAMKRNQKPLGDDQPSTTATRGDWIPLIIGLRRTGCVVGAIPPDSREEINVEGPGGALVEAAWHQLCIGPADEIHKIYSANEVIWDTKITRAESPSGSTFILDNEKGQFTVYWGEDDQPLNPYLSTYLGHKSLHPRLCYIWWNRRNLGSSPIWEQHEYVVKVGCPRLVLKNSSYQISTDGVTAKGVNFAHAILQIICAPKPHGMGRPLSDIDNDSLEAVGEVMEAEGMGCNLIITEGRKGSEVLQDLLQDGGIAMTQVNGRLHFRVLRASTDTVPVIEDDVVLPPDFEININHDEPQATSSLFTFKDEREYAYRDMDIAFDDDAEIGDAGNSKQQAVQLNTITNGVPADKIASRRWQESAAGAALSFVGLRGLRRLLPGSLIEHPVLGRLLATNVTPQDMSAEAKIDVTPDVYGIEPQGDGSNPADTNPIPPLPPGVPNPRVVAPDTAFNWFELPSDLAGGMQSVAVFRLRSNGSIRGSSIMASIDGGPYAKIGNQDATSAGGFLDAAIPAATPDTIVYGPVFEDVNGSAPDILDLTGDVAGWQGGVQVACINDEVFYLQSVTVQSEVIWTPNTAYTAGSTLR